MIILNKTEEVQKHTDKIINECEEKKKQYVEDIQSVNNDIYETLTAFNNISVKDFEQYHTYKNKLEELEDERRTLEHKLKTARELPLISHEEYNELVKTVKDEIKEAEAQTREKLVKLSEEANELGQELQEATKQSNKALSDIQRGLYKEKEPLTYETFNTVLWAGAGVDTLPYRVETNKKINGSIEKLTKI